MTVKRSKNVLFWERPLWRRWKEQPKAAHTKGSWTLRSTEWSRKWAEDKHITGEDTYLADQHTRCSAWGMVGPQSNANHSDNETHHAPIRTVNMEKKTVAMPHGSETVQKLQYAYAADGNRKRTYHMASNCTGHRSQTNENKFLRRNVYAWTYMLHVHSLNIYNGPSPETPQVFLFG